MSIIRRAAAAGAVLATAAGGSLVAAQPAQAVSTWNGCNYPQVCIYNSDRAAASTLSARFTDVTSYTQNTATRTTWSLLNTRNDDIVYVRMRNVRTGAVQMKCVNPNSGLLNMRLYGWQITGLRISSASHC